MTFVPPGVIWCADFEFGIRLPFICVEVEYLEPSNTQKKMSIFTIFYFDPQKRTVGGRNASHSSPTTVRNVLVSALACSDTKLSANSHFGHFWVIDLTSEVIG